MKIHGKSKWGKSLVWPYSTLCVLECLIYFHIADQKQNKINEQYNITRYKWPSMLNFNCPVKPILITSAIIETKTDSPPIDIKRFDNIRIYSFLYSSKAKILNVFVVKKNLAKLFE